MKLIACSVVALLAIVGIAMAQNFNNFNNDDGFFGNDDGFFGNDDDGFFGDDDNTWAFGGVGHGAGVSHVSSGGSWGSSWGGSWGGMGGGMGGGMIGYGKSPVSYIPLPVHAGGKSGGAGSFCKYF